MDSRLVDDAAICSGNRRARVTPVLRGFPFSGLQLRPYALDCLERYLP
jgi:hypothetical protein